ncbi:MAG: response regulator [Hydrogenophaga sp.]|uniref:hybrid sensor histidine kinase/response regulator n=1 Tax=Hydrogenophaga sp. TaxID=1904254 RepID=UPI001DFCA813|nr:hybrid sensor histidine kinase/response regulator [Hydrogenophaga sp.]MBX3608928.1 response regulator [Hydrogenophaga sp.]
MSHELPAVRRVKLELLLQKFGPGATLAILPFATATALFFQHLRPGPLAGVWLGVFYVLALVRFVHMRAIVRMGRLGDDDIEPVLRVVTRYMVVTGLVWGLAPWMIMPLDDGLYKGLMTALMLGVVSTAGAVYASHRRTIAAVHVPAAIGLITALIWSGTALDWLLVVTTVAYIATSRRLTFNQAELLSSSLAARFENEDLAHKLAQQVELVEEANREKSRFLASASHDLRQPLHAISLFTSVLQGAGLGGSNGETVSRLGHSVRMLSESLDTMLDVSRLDAGAVQPHLQAIRLHALFVSLHNTFGFRAQEKGLQLRMRAPGDLVVSSDPMLLERLLGNLIDNAIKYTERGGVVIAARAPGVGARAGRLRIDIVDTGVGIAPRFQKLVFDEYYQVDNPQRNRTRGLGIGLSIVRRLSELLAHEVQLRSRPERGTRFSVWVPLAHARPDVSAPETGMDFPMVDRRRLPAQVLVLDDEPDSREALASLLRSHGCLVQMAADVDEAERALQHHDVQAVVADFRLPGERNGLEFLLALRNTRPELQGLLVTGETLPARIAAIKASGVPCLFKPVRAEALLAALVR